MVWAVTLAVDLFQKPAGWLAFVCCPQREEMVSYLDLKDKNYLTFEE